MTFQAKSRLQQWTLWSCGALLALLAYVLVSYIVLGRIRFNLFDPRAYRIAMPVVALYSLFAWETRWNGMKAKARGERDATLLSRANNEGVHHCPPPPHLSTFEAPAGTDAVPGEALYVQARQIPHQEIPDYATDGLYLDLVGDAAAAGYAPAMAKLGEYARRRAAWVEAYYWTWRARKGGVQSLDPVLRAIRQRWMAEGSPSERSNVYELFSKESGSIGRALLAVDSGRNAYSAREFLKAHYPEFVSA